MNSAEVLSCPGFSLLPPYPEPPRHRLRSMQKHNFSLHVCKTRRVASRLRGIIYLADILVLWTVFQRSLMCLCDDKSVCACLCMCRFAGLFLARKERGISGFATSTNSGKIPKVTLLGCDVAKLERFQAVVAPATILSRCL